MCDRLVAGSVFALFWTYSKAITLNVMAQSRTERVFNVFFI